MKDVDLHLAVASRQGASREAVRLLGLASIQSTVADAGHGPFPNRIRDAVNQMVHSTTLRISFLDASNPRVPRDQWVGSLQEAALLHMETDKRARLTVPVRPLINAYLEHVQTGFDKHFGARLNQWNIWAVI